VLCIRCKSSFLLPTPPPGSPSLIQCPYCEFIGLWEGGEKITIPTYKEEKTLPHFHGVPTTPPGTGEKTLWEGEEVELPLPYKRKLFLKFLTGLDQGALVPFPKGKVILGREGDIVIRDRKVSRKHALIEAISRENIYLRDLSSRNGTYLNGVRIQSKKLKQGDIIRLGDTQLEFLWEDEP
jgi:hypothetical protein